MQNVPHDIYAQLTIEDMPSEEIQRVAQIAGVELAMKLTQSFAGQNVYFPKYWLQNCLSKVIRIMLAKGYERKKICKTLGISRMTFYRALNMKVSGSPIVHRAKPPKDSQMDFFKEDPT